MQPHASSNPFRNALHKFAKKKDKATNAHAPSTGGSTGFFSRAAKGVNKQQALPGSVKQVNAGQLPPVWATPTPAPPRKLSSPNGGVTRSQAVETSSLGSSEHEEETTVSMEKLSVGSKSLDAPATTTTTANSTANTPATANRPTARSSVGNHRCEQFNALLRTDTIDLDKLRQLSWGGISYEHRPTAWRILLVRPCSILGLLTETRVSNQHLV
jgi:TBC1 domain family member 2